MGLGGIGRLVMGALEQEVDGAAAGWKDSVLAAGWVDGGRKMVEQMHRQLVGGGTPKGRLGWAGGDGWRSSCMGNW